MKNIAYIATAFPVLSETFIGNEIRALKRLNHNVKLATFSLSKDSGQEADMRLAREATELRSIHWTETFKTLISSKAGLQNAMQFVNKQNGLPKRSLLWYGAKFATFVRKSGCEHIHAHFGLSSTATAIVAAKLIHTPISFTCHGYDIYKTPADLPLKLLNATFAVAVCDMMKEDMLKLAPDANVLRVRCGVDTTNISQYKVPNYNTKRLIYIGRLSETKGLPVLLQALASLPTDERPSVDIVGDGPLKEDLETLARHLNLDSCISFLGPKKSHWINNNYVHYSGLVAPFIVTPFGTQDTGPLVIKEAMMFKLPIITTDIRACLEMLDNKVANTPLAMVVKTGCSLSLANGLRDFLAISAEAKQLMAQNAFEHLMNNFVIDDQVKQLSNAFESIK